MSLSDRVVQSVPLTLAGGQEEAPEAGAGSLPQDLVGGICRAVGDDDDLQPITGIVELAKVVELVGKPNLLIVGRDDERNRRKLRRVLGGRARVAPRPEIVPVAVYLHEGVGEEEHDRVQEIGVRHQEKRPPEDELRKGHGRLRTYCAPRPKSAIVTASTGMRRSSQNDRCVM